MKFHSHVPMNLFCLQFMMWVWNFLPMYDTFYTYIYETFYPCMKLTTNAWSFQPKYDTFYPYIKLHSHVWKLLPMYETFYPSMKLPTHVWNFLPMYETFLPMYETYYPCMKLTTHVWNYFLTWMQNLLWVTDLRPRFKVPTFAQKVLYFFTWVWDPKTWFWRTPSNGKKLLHVFHACYCLAQSYYIFTCRRVSVCLSVCLWSRFSPFSVICTF
jgi:hypothetical protein